MEQRERAVVPLGMRAPAVRRERGSLVAAGTRALALAVRSPVVRRTAALGLAMGIGYQLSRARQAARLPAPEPRGNRRVQRTDHPAEPAGYGWVRYTAMSVTRVYQTRRPVE